VAPAAPVPPLPPRPPVPVAQAGIGPGPPPLPPPAVSNVPIRLATCCSAGPKLASQIDDEIPLPPKALTH
jgi:hypothetical protein